MPLKLDCPKASEMEARALMAALTTAEPEVTETVPPTDPTRDPALLIGLATLILTIPGAVLATLEIKDRLDRREVKRTLEALKAKLAETEGSARLTLPSGTSVELARTSTDAAVDLIIKDLSQRS